METSTSHKTTLENLSFGNEVNAGDHIPTKGDGLRRINTADDLESAKQDLYAIGITPNAEVIVDRSLAWYKNFTIPSLSETIASFTKMKAGALKSLGTTA